MIPIGVSSQQPTPPGMTSLYTDMRAWYKCQEGSGSRVDAYDNAAPFDILWAGSNDPGSRAGIRGNGWDFSGTHNVRYINRDATGASQLGFGTPSFSLSCWVYADTYDGTARYFFARRTGSSNGYSLFCLDNPSFGLVWSVQGGASAEIYGAGFSAGSWHHVYCWWDGVNVGIRVNDQYENTSSNTTGPTTTYAHYYAGGDQINSQKADGSLDELAFWRRTLTAEEVTWLYNAGAGRTFEDIDGVWTPHDLTGLQQWHHWGDKVGLWQDTGRATAITASAETVGYSDNRGGALSTGFDQSTASSEPAWNSGGYIDTASADYLESDSSPVTPDTNDLLIGLAWVQKDATNGGIWSWGSSVVTGNPFLLLTKNASGIQWYYDSGYRQLDTYTLDKFYYHVLRVTGGTGSRLVDVWFNGVKGSQVNTGTGLNFENIATPQWIGAGFGATSNHQHFYAFVHSEAADGTYTDADAEALSDYLATLAP